MNARQSCPYEGCTTNCSSKRTLKEHLNIHLGIKPYKCKEKGCDASFASAGNLSKHLIMHSGEKNYKCTEKDCDKSFNRKEHLEVHMRTHTNEKPYSCIYPGCNDTFSHKSTLTAHMRFHNNEKPYKCTYENCNAEFTQSIHLRVHMRSHTGEKPYKCSYNGCILAFTTKNQLDMHMRTHTKEKPYQCSYDGCNHRFARIHHLHTHMYTHTDERPYRCTEEGCDASFVINQNLKNHIKSMHTLEGQMRHKKEEQRIASVLDNANIAYKREHQIDFICIGSTTKKYARIDFLIDINGCIVMLEVDEDQHRFGYGSISCDLRRMAQIQESLTIEGNSIPIVFLRYNPNTFTVDDMIMKISKKDRERTLVQLLKNPFHLIWRKKKPIIIQYMFYDIKDGNAEILNDPEYNDVLRLNCVPSIYKI
jgi:KRAB domain-containing zinc finger protein